LGAKFLVHLPTPACLQLVKLSTAAKDADDTDYRTLPPDSSRELGDVIT